MPISPIPEDRAPVLPLLSVKDASKALEFVKQVFSAETLECHRSPDGVLRHGEARIGSSVIMLSEACEPYGVITGALYVYVPDVDAAFARAVAAGATVVAPVTTQFYGDRHGGVRDPFGVTWWMASRVESVSPAEMERRTKEYMAAQAARSKT